MTVEWTMTGPRITDTDVLARLRRILDDESPLVVEHRFFQGSRAPHRFVCDDADALDEYLATRTRPGDSFYLWSFLECCTDERVVANGKVPDAEGRTPQGGAY